MTIYEAKKQEAVEMLKKAAAEISEMPVISSEAFKTMENAMKLEAEEAKAVASVRKLLMYYSREVPVSQLIPSEIARVIITDFVASIVKDESSKEFKKAYEEMLKDEESDDLLGIVMDENESEEEELPSELDEDEEDEEYDFQSLLSKLKNFQKERKKEGKTGKWTFSEYARSQGKTSGASKQLKKSGKPRKRKLNAAQAKLMAGRASKVAEYTARYTPMSTSGLIHQQFDLSRIEY